MQSEATGLEQHNEEHSESSTHESGAPPQREPGRVRRRWRLMRRRGLGVSVGLLIPVVGLGWGSRRAVVHRSRDDDIGCGDDRGGERHAGSGWRSWRFAGHAASGGGSNARSTNAAGGSVGTVSGVSSSGFTLSPPNGGTVTVKETSSTVYEQGTRKPRRAPSPRGPRSSCSARSTARRSPPPRSS